MIPNDPMLPPEMTNSPHPGGMPIARRGWGLLRSVGLAPSSAAQTPPPQRGHFYSVREGVISIGGQQRTKKKLTHTARSSTLCDPSRDLPHEKSSVPY